MIAILSVIAVVAVPIVIQQAERAGPVRIAHDLASVRTAADLFHLQTRTAYAHYLDDLITGISITDTELDGSTYTAGEVSGWSGPYLDPVLAAPRGNIHTGSDVEIENFFEFFDVDANTAVAASNRGIAEFVAISTTTMTSTTFEAVNDIIDGEAEPDGYGPGLSSHSGRFRLVPPVPTPIASTNVSGWGYYLAIPY